MPLVELTQRRRRTPPRRSARPSARRPRGPCAVRRSSRTPIPPERSTGGGCAVHVSASASTRRSVSRTAVVPSRSSSSGARGRRARARGGAAGAARPRPRRAGPARPRAAARRAAVSIGTSRPRSISRCGGARSAVPAAGAGVAHRADRRPGGEPVEHVALGGVGPRDQLGRRGPGRRAPAATAAPARGCGGRRQAETAQHRHQLEVGHHGAAAAAAGRPSPPGYGPIASRTVGREVQQVGVAPDEREVEQRVEAVVGAAGRRASRRRSSSRRPRRGPASRARRGWARRARRWRAGSRCARPTRPASAAKSAGAGRARSGRSAEQRGQLAVVAAAQPLGQRGGAAASAHRRSRERRAMQPRVGRSAPVGEVRSVLGRAGARRTAFRPAAGTRVSPNGRVGAGGVGHQLGDREVDQVRSPRNCSGSRGAVPAIGSPFSAGSVVGLVSVSAARAGGPGSP